MGDTGPKGQGEIWVTLSHSSNAGKLIRVEYSTRADQDRAGRSGEYRTTPAETEEEMIVRGTAQGSWLTEARSEPKSCESGG